VTNAAPAAPPVPQAQPAPQTQPALPTPPVSPTPPTVTVSDDANIPVAPIAKVEDYSGTATPPATNSAPIAPPPAKPDNADGRGGF